MPDRPHNRMSKLIGEQAAIWLLRLREGDLRGSEKLEYVRWLKRSPAHVRAMLELASLEGLLRRSDLDGIPPGQGPRSGQPESTVVELIPRRQREETPSEERRRSPWLQWKLAASAWLSRTGFAGRAISKLVGICS